MTLDQALALVADALAVDPAMLSASSGLNREPRWDSLAHVQVMLALERHCGITINDDAVQRYSTIEAISELDCTP